MLNLLDVLGNRLSGGGIVGIPTFISFDAIPQTKLADIVFEDPNTEIYIIFDLQKVYAFFIRLLSPSWKVDLHDADGITSRYGERVRTAFDNRNAGNQERIDVVLPSAGHNRGCDAL